MPAWLRRITTITVALVVTGVVLPGVAQAAPPTNDEVGASTVVEALPFAVQQDTGEATEATDDPFWCQGFNVGGTVWFSYTATENVLLRASTAGSDHWTILAAHTGVPGGLVPIQDGCGVGTFGGAAVTIRATAGTTYHFMVAGYNVAGGALSFGLQVVPPAPNDAFADAEPVDTLPFTRTIDLATASTEPDEAAARCASSANRTVWYAFTPTAAVSVVARLDRSENAVSVYTGPTLLDLREIDCARGSFDSLLFRATAGVTYYLKVSGSGAFGPDTLNLTEAPPLRPSFDTSPSDPSIYEETVFHADSGQFDVPIASGQWDFGDGSTAPLGEFDSTAHHYTADGTYQVRLSIVSADGRTGTITRPVTVTTHDVSISKFAVPAKARTGETKQITVHVANTRYRESGVTVELFKSDGRSWTEVGTLTLDVPARPDRAVKFPFAYTFTPADAVVGKVTFRAVVSLPFGVRDARPVDNEVIAISTTVRPAAPDSEPADQDPAQVFDDLVGRI
ncbi:MAG TPA: PKD domain-containing protein [Actinophytocola sp.]|uniref:PKD domain-containing protein n=1 Tax=Actinophytocola sp. TaxID=1872138 RepID=UPI002DB798C2|nr:PKD domain-containing protein [Actinophytocola sp.]HEU5470998.1 PKD domain-containing protein [Actinophytocola sp.]